MRRMEVHISQHYYIPGCSERRSEIDSCLAYNLSLASDLIRLHIFCEVVPPSLTEWLDCPYVSFIFRADKDRMMYRDWLSYTANHIPNGSLSLLINSDIAVYDIQFLLNNCVDDDYFLCFSRYESFSSSRLTPDAHLKQDAWAIVNNPGSRYNHMSSFSDIPLGIPGCDNRIAGVAWEAGYKVSNLSEATRFVHLHASSSRAYAESDRVHGLYIFPYPVDSLIPSNYILSAFRSPGQFIMPSMVSIFDGHILHSVYSSSPDS